MAKRKVFYSFHFENDVMRTMMVRNIGVIEGNTPVSANDWEEVKRGGTAAIQRWIDQTMRGRECLVVLIGTETANRPWVDYEIRKAWSDGLGVTGIYIHDLNCPRTRSGCAMGPNPFARIQCDNGQPLSTYIRCHAPTPANAYQDIATNIDGWIASAARLRR